MSKAAATASAFAVAAMVPGVCLAGFEAIQAGHVSDFGFVLFFTLAVSIAATVTLALPGYLLLDRHKLVSIPAILLAGLVIGAIVGVIVLYPAQPDANSLGYFAGTGFIASISFWLVRRLLMGKSTRVGAA